MITPLRLVPVVAIWLPTAMAIAQESRALLHAPMVHLPVDSAPLQRLGDFDGDGDLDVVGTRVFSTGLQNEIRVWENQQGALTEVWQGTYPLAGVAGGTLNLLVETADFNGDQRTDFAVAGGLGVVSYLSQPNFTFQTTTFATAWPVRQLAVGDFDADGLVDLAVEVTGTVHFLLGDGTVLTSSASALSSLRMLAIELDGVPGDDLLFASPSDAYIWALENGQLVFRDILSSVFQYQAMWMGGDIDSDGDIDVVVFDSPQYQVFRRTSPSTFVTEAPAVGGPAEYLADIDGDGDLDGVCCSGGGGGGPLPSWPKLDFVSNYQLSINDGSGGFAPAWSVPGAGSRSMAGAADMDGDGDVDLVAGRCIYYGRGAFGEHAMPLAAGSESMRWFRPWLVRDFDRDGDPDIVNLGKLINDGRGGLVPGAGVPAPLSGQSTDFFNIDIDGDGAVDQIVLRSTSPPQTSLLRNNGGGHLTDAGPITVLNGPVGTWLQAVPGSELNIAADLDGDGDDDILTGWPASILWNNGGTFVPGPSVGVWVRRVADFDGDGLPDLFASTVAGVELLRGTAVPGQFTTVWTGQLVGYAPAAQAAADLNDDGLLDFVAADGLGFINLFVNTSQLGVSYGFTRFVLPIQIPVYSWASAEHSTVTASDFDGDGKTDLAIGPIFDSATGIQPGVGVVLRRIGWSSPPSIGDYEVTRLLFESGFAADVDGDGDDDLVGDRLARNPRFHGPAAGARQQRRAGTAGEAGAVPVLGATGPFRGGEVEVLQLTGVPGPTIAVLAWSLGELQQPIAPLPGLSLWLDPALAVVGDWPIVANGQGRAAAMVTLQVPLPTGLQGLTFFSQAFVLDLAAPSLVTQSNLLQQRFGN